MKVIVMGTAIVVAIAGFALPVRSQETPIESTPTAQQAQVTKREILTACVEDRVEVLPPLYSDVPPDHWAYSSVQKIGYCGPYRSATPPNLIERLIREDESLPNPAR